MASRGSSGRLVTLVALLPACAVATVSPLRPAIDPKAHLLDLVAFGPTTHSYVALERTWGPTPKCDLLMMDSQLRTKVRLTQLSPQLQEELRATDEPSQLRQILRRSGIVTKEAYGFELPHCQTTESVRTPYGELSLHLQAVQLADGEIFVDAASLPELPITEHHWCLSPDGTRAALSISYRGSPAVRDLRVVHLPTAAARLLAMRAFEAHQRQAYLQAATLWEESHRLDPEAADTLYNIACAYARLEQPQQALPTLRRAIELGGSRFRDLAKSDPDLDTLRTTEEMRELLGD